MKQRINQIYESKRNKYKGEQLELLSIAEKQILFLQLFNEAVLEAQFEDLTMGCAMK